MSAISNIILAFSMSADAFAASVSKGVALRRPKFTDAMRIGMVFGGIEAVTPVIGWLIGLAASSFIQSVDHWVAFVILAIVGGKMIFEGFGSEHKDKSESHKLSVLVFTAIGTSIDAMAVGVTLALIDANIWLTAFMIGMATFMMSTIGIMTGHYIGTKAGKLAEISGGVCLISIGAKILCEHLGVI
jgi:putative Mn2+ efflux pump MntP